MGRSNFKRHRLVILPFLILFLLHVSSCEKKNVKIPVLAPIFLFNSDRYSYYVAMKYAFDLINQSPDILKDYHLVPKFYDTVGSVSKSLYLMNEIVHVDKCTNRKVPPVIVGPAFSNTAIATSNAIALYYILQYTYGATSPLLDNHYDYPFLVRTLPGTSVFSNGHVALMKRFGWTRAAIIYDHHTHDGIFNRITEDLIAKLRANNLTVVGAESVDSGAGDLATPDDEIRTRLERLKAADVKILFAQFSWIGAYRVFCQAYRLGMFGKNYVWIVHPRVESVERWLDSPNQSPRLRNQLNKCTEEQYKLISDRMLYFQQQAFREDNMKTFSGLTAKEYNAYILKHRIKKQNPSFYTATSHGYAFDTVWSMALTLDRAIPELAKINSSLDNMLIKNITQAKILRKIAHEVEFEGITGTMKLNRAQGRIGTLTLYQIKDKKWHEVGRFDGTQGAKGKLEFLPNAEKNLWIGGRVPRDKSKQRTALQSIPLGLYLPICIVAALGVLLSIGVLLFNIYNRNERYIRKSAPLFNNLIILGIMMSLSTVVFFGFPVDKGDTDTFLTMCRLRSWVLCLGFSLSFGSMFVKTWRVYKIFTNRKLKYSIERLSNLSLLGMVVAIVAIDIAVLVLWHFIDPMEVKINTLPKKPDPDDADAVLLPILYACHSENQAKWITTIYVLKGILLLYGLFLAYETRNVQFEHLNDSRMIGVSVYNVAVMSLLGGLLRIILKEAYFKESFGITAICIIFPSLGTLVLIFLPKVVRFVKRDSHVTETETSDGVVIEGPAARNGNHFHLRKDSVCSEGVTSVTSSIPCSNSRIMPIYEEATASPQDGSFGSESPA